MPNSLRTHAGCAATLKAGDYSLSIPEGKDSGVAGAVFLRHKEHYSLCLGNHGDYACDAAVFIDGTLVGTYRLKSGQTATIERPCNSSARFTFFAEGTVEAALASSGDKAQIGNLRIVFTPGVTRKERADIGTLKAATDLIPVPTWDEAIPRSRDEPGRILDTSAENGGLWFTGSQLFASRVHLDPVSGVTGLTGQSDQEFEIAAQDLEFIPSAVKTLSVRLLAEMPQTRSGLRSLLAKPRLLKAGACLAVVAGLTAYFWSERSGHDLITPAEVAQNEGKTVVVEAVLTEARRYKDVVYLNFGGKYPNQEFAVMLSSKLALRIADNLDKQGQTFESVQDSGIFRIKGPVRRQKSGVTIEPGEANDVVWRKE